MVVGVDDQWGGLQEDLDFANEVRACSVGLCDGLGVLLVCETLFLLLLKLDRRDELHGPTKCSRRRGIEPGRTNCAKTPGQTKLVMGIDY